MEVCPKCLNGHFVKNEIIGSRQRLPVQILRLPLCGFLPSRDEYRDQTVGVGYVFRGLGFRSIGRILKCSHVSVYKWIKKAGKEAEERQQLEDNEPSEEVEHPESAKAETPIKEVEIDEMHSFIWSKDQSCWIWIAVDRIRKKIHRFRDWRPTAAGIRGTVFWCCRRVRFSSSGFLFGSFGQ